ncbi:MAG TPA: AAA family ATPase [Saprospiraceae bacterium]|nr:AAA family ATPase [Saprospiraceae bacterium]HMQ81288.1 AAA family ATPase [Saprospiraceae bacterium]
MTKPVILLAFANEQESRQSYLRNLPLEINQLDRILGKAADEGLCDYKILTNATLPGLFEVFRDKKYRDRIAIFHFSGHADSWSLMLESDQKKSKAVRSDWIGELFADQRSLQLVFLNGCFSIQQAEQLRDKGIPACIGTVAEVADRIAYELSTAFYNNLTAGLSIDRSWKMATQEVSSDKDTSAAAEYYHQDEARGPILRANINRFPWEILYRDPNGEVLQWNLPTAAGNPLFGLPPIPADKYPLPNEPFRFLGRYTEKDAGVFFGRGEALQQLYRKITASSGAPLVLLHGQSGVGKSSLIHAGLVPRLESDYAVIYLRRDGEKGLMLQLFEALGVDNAASTQPREDREVVKARIQDDIRQLEATLSVLEGDARQQVERLIQNYQSQLQKLEQNLPEINLDLAENWRKIEQSSSKKGLILFVDQLEEVITRPNEKLPNELDSFLNQVRLIFEPIEKRPSGKLVLSYRKEYHPEILKAIKNHQILKEEYFLTRLDKKGVIEIITGLTTTEQLREKYNLNIDPGLPLEMANNLVSDPDSPIAPILQIILTKLWQAQAHKTAPRFSVEDYRQLQEKGILLNDFFKQQMEKIAAWEEKTGHRAVSSGLALDILNYHTTRLSTAESRDMNQLRMLYQHQEALLDGLINEFKQHYLLSEAEQEYTALAHDTLAPIIHRQMRDSDKPGQRALRILETKVIDFIKNPDETIIEEEDLGAVEDGKNGMRTWMPIEEELIEKSRDHRAALRAYRLRNKRIRLFAVVAISLLAGLATWLWLQSEKRAKVIANDALFNEGRLEVLTDPVTGIAKMEAAYLAMSEKDAGKLAAIYQTYNANLFYQIQYQPKDRGFLKQVAFSNDGKYWASSSDMDHKILLFDAQNQKEIAVFEQAAGTCTDLVFGTDNTLWIGSIDRNVYHWNWQNQQVSIFADEEDKAPVRNLSVSQDGKWLLVAHNDNRVKCWAVAEPEHSMLTWPEESEATDYKINSIALSLDKTSREPQIWIGTKSDELLLLDRFGKQSFIASFEHASIDQVLMADTSSKAYLLVNGKVEILELLGTKGHLRSSLDQFTDVVKIALTPDHRLLLGARRGGKGFVWDISKKQLLYEIKGHRADIHSLAFSASPDRILTGSADTSIRQWNLYSPYPQRQVQAGYYSINSLVYSPDGKHLASVNSANECYIQELRTGKMTALPAITTVLTSPLIFSPDGQILAIGDEKGQVHLFDLATGQSKGKLEFLPQSIIDLVWTEKGIVALHENGLLSCKNYPNGALSQSQQGDFSAIEMGANGGLAALSSGDIFFLSLPDLKVSDQASFSAHGSKWYGLIAGADELILQADGDKALVFDLASKHFDGYLPMTSVADFNEDKTVFLSSKLAPCHLGLYHAEGYLLQELYEEGACQISALAVHPAGTHFVAGTRDGRLLFWENGRAKLSLDRKK